MPMIKKVTTVIEIAEQEIKILQGRTKDGIAHISYFYQLFWQNHNEPAFKEILRKWSFGSKTICFLPRRLAIFRVFHLPAQNKTEIEKMIPLQLVACLPYSLEEIIYSYEIIGSDRKGYTTVLAVVFLREIVGKYLRLFNDLKISLSCLSVSSFGILSWFYAQNKDVVLNSEEIFLAIDVRRLCSEICFFQNKKLLFSRSVFYGAKNIEDKDFFAFVDEIEKSILTVSRYQKECSIEKLFVISDPCDLKEFENELFRRFHKKVCILEAGKQEEYFSKRDVFCGSVCLGGIFLENFTNINLLPSHTGKLKEYLRKKKGYVFILVLLLLVFFIGCGFLHYGIQSRVKKINFLSEELKKVKEQFHRAEKKTEVLKTLKEQMTSRLLIADVFEQLSRIMPEGVFLTAFFMHKSNFLTIEGDSLDNQQISKLQEQLLDSLIFTDVKLDFSTQRQRHNSEIRHFKISMQIKRKSLQ